MVSSCLFFPELDYKFWILSVVLAVILWHILAKEIRLRKKARKMLKAGLQFKQDIITGKTKLFYCYRGKFLSLDCDGDEIYVPYFVNERGKETTVLPEIRREFYIAPLTSDSMLPDNAYRSTVDKVCLKQNGGGAPYMPMTLQVYFKPANDDISTWSIIKVEKANLVLEHPQMGMLCVPKHFRKNAKIGEEITLISKVSKTAKCYQIKYETV